MVYSYFPFSCAMPFVYVLIHRDNIPVRIISTRNIRSIDCNGGECCYYLQRNHIGGYEGEFCKSGIIIFLFSIGVNDFQGLDQTAIILLADSNILFIGCIIVNVFSCKWTTAVIRENFVPVIITGVGFILWGWNDNVYLGCIFSWCGKHNGYSCFLGKLVHEP